MAMVVIGAIVTAGYTRASQNTRITSGIELAHGAFYSAEAGLEEALGTWRSDALKAIEPGTEVDLGSQLLSTRGAGHHTGYRIRVRRLEDHLFLVRSEGWDSAGRRGARREVARMVKTETAGLPRPTALSILGSLSVGGSSRINGRQASDAECPPVAPDAPGVTTPDPALVTALSEDHIVGDPTAIETAPALNRDSLSTFGGLSLSELIATADVRFPSGIPANSRPGPSYRDAENEVCDTDDPLNWGEPMSGTGCSDRIPVIHSKGNAEITGGRGQGILIVEGDLTMQGNAQFHGVVVVTGKLYMRGTGTITTPGKIIGAAVVFSGAEFSEESTVTGNSEIEYSSCRVDRALSASQRPRLIAKRSWIDMAGSVAIPDISG